MIQPPETMMEMPIRIQNDEPMAPPIQQPKMVEPLIPDHGLDHTGSSSPYDMKMVRAKKDPMDPMNNLFNC